MKINRNDVQTQSVGVVAREMRLADTHERRDMTLNSEKSWYAFAWMVGCSFLFGCASPLERAARTGDTNAQYQLGIEQDNIAYLKKAAAKGHVDAQYELGKRYVEHKIPISTGIALNGVPVAAATATISFTSVEDGKTYTRTITQEDVRRDQEEIGVAWLKKAAAAGNRPAAELLESLAASRK